MIMTDGETLKVALAQVDIAWEQPKVNLDTIYRKAKEAASEEVDLLVFPEVMTTGFSMQLDRIAEPVPARSVEQIKAFSRETGVAIVFSLMVEEQKKYYNRVYMLTPDGEVFCQDKRHLFRMGGESELVSSATQRMIFTYKGWRILLIACYDLRFPVWCRNKGNEYDLLIDVANWPEPRRAAWSTLLRARAIENIAYVCGVNRVGVDPEGFVYTGDSALIDPKGQDVVLCAPREEALKVAVIHKEPLEKMRSKFPAWKDVDPFVLDPTAPYPLF